MDDGCALILNIVILCVVFMLGKVFGYKRAYGDGIKACVNTIQTQGYDETYNQGYQAGLRDSISITVQAGGYGYNITNTTTSISAILGSAADDDYARNVLEDALSDSMAEDRHTFGALELFQCLVLIIVGFLICACFFAFAVAEYDKAYPNKAKHDGSTDNDSDTWTKETAMTTTPHEKSGKTARLLQSEGNRTPTTSENKQNRPESGKESDIEESDVETASSGTVDTRTRTDEGYIAPNTYQYIIRSDLA